MKEKVVWLDFETRSSVDIAAAGGYRYCEDAEPILLGVAVNDAPAEVVDLTAADIPDSLLELLRDPEVTLVAHNAMFDRQVMRWLVPETEDPRRWKDSMVLALAHGFPGALADLCARLGLPSDKAKDADGRRLIRIFCQPRKDGRFVQPEEAPEDWRKFANYCRLDVEAMRECWRRLPHVNDKHALWSEWALDQRVNDRGMGVDIDLARAGLAAAEKAKEDANGELGRLTEGRVTTAFQRDRILDELKRLGVTASGLDAEEVSRLQAMDDLPDAARALLVAREAGSRSSTGKFRTLLDATGSGGRIRGCFQFCGAARTGRWGGRLFQPQNLPRGSLHGDEVDLAIRALKSGAAGVLYGSLASVASSCIRGCVVPSPGKRLVVADLSNIEGRVLAWLAGEGWKLDAFRAFDAGVGPDIYKATYARTFGGSPDDVTKAQRQVGKVLELAMGYGGGVGAFLAFAGSLDMEAFARATLDTMDEYERDASGEAWDWASSNGKTLGLRREVFVACDCVKNRWRKAHPATVDFWSDCEMAALTAIRSPEKFADPTAVCSAGRVGFRPYDGGIMARLPSGRYVLWPRARLAGASERCAFVFMDQKGFAKTFAGRIAENLTQAVARDVLAHGMALAEASGFDVVGHVHDELLTEAAAPRDESGLAACMADPPRWARDLPLAAAGFVGDRYRKD